MKKLVASVFLFGHPVPIQRFMYRASVLDTL